MISYEYTGWVEKIKIESYGIEIVMRTDFDEKDVKYPQHVLFKVSKKNTGKIPEGLCKDDKVTVKFMPFLNEGVSKNTGNPYAIMGLMVQELSLIAKSSTTNKEVTVDDNEMPDDLPF